MGASQSVPQQIISLSKNGNYHELKAFLDDLQRMNIQYQRDPKLFLDATDDEYFSPLILSTMRGHYQVVELLLQRGASVNLQNRVHGSPLHCALTCNQRHILDILLRYNANPLVENEKGMTPMDIAQSTSNVALLRRFETNNMPWIGWLHMKIKPALHLAHEWRPHWVVICHRFRSPFRPPEQQLTHLVLLAYPNKESCKPSCRVWLDGATAKEALNPSALDMSEGRRPSQVDVYLHRAYKKKPSGCYVSGDSRSGYVIHFRPGEFSQLGCSTLDLFMTCINGRGMITNGAASTGNGGGRQQWINPQAAAVEQDEAMARRLQEEEDLRFARRLQFDNTSNTNSNTTTNAYNNNSTASLGGSSFQRPGTLPSQDSSDLYPSPVFSTMLPMRHGDILGVTESTRPSAPLGSMGNQHASGTAGGGGSKDQETAQRAEKPTCIICLDAEPNYAFLHIKEGYSCACVCFDCGERHMQCEREKNTTNGPACPKCKQTIQGFTRVYCN